MGDKVARTPRAEIEVAVIVPRRDLCLDFVNTLYWRGSDVTESLQDVGELLRWSSQHGVIDQASCARLEPWAAMNPAASGAMFDEAIALRESLYHILFAVTRKEAPPAHDVASFNAALGRAPVRHKVEPVEHGFGWRIEGERRTLPSLLAPVLWAAADLLVNPELARLRVCANLKCLWLFLDESKNGSRRWCSMQACGNRAKAHRHYLRQKAF